MTNHNLGKRPDHARTLAFWRGRGRVGRAAEPRLAAQSSRPGMGAIPHADALGTGVTSGSGRRMPPAWRQAGFVQRLEFNANYLVKESVSSGIWSGDIPAARNGNEYKYYLSGSL